MAGGKGKGPGAEGQGMAGGKGKGPGAEGQGRAKVQKVKDQVQKDAGLERDKVKTRTGTWLNIAGKEKG